jgi:hypothetical protein
MHALELLADGALPCTRRHALKLFAASLSTALVVPRPARGGDLPWGEEPTATRLSAQSTGLKLRGKGAAMGIAQDLARQFEPTVALEPGGRRLWTSWTQLHEGRESLLLRSLTPADGAWSEPLVLASGADTNVYDSELIAVGTRLLVVWAQVAPGGWTLAARAIDPATGELGPVHVLAGGADRGEFHAHPAAAVIGDEVLVVWQAREEPGRPYCILGQRLNRDGRPAGNKGLRLVDAENDCAWPALASHGQQVALVWDRTKQDGTSRIHLALLAPNGEIEADHTVSGHPSRNLAPACAFSPDGQMLWIAWHSDRHGADGWDMPRWYRLTALRLADHTWHTPTGGCGKPEQEERDTVQGCELVRLAVSPRGVVCVLGRASHNFYVQYYSSAGRSPRYRLPEDGWGGRGRLLRGAFDEAGLLWLVRRDLERNVLHCAEGLAELAGPPPLAPDEEPTRSAPVAARDRMTVPAWPPVPPAAAGLRLYFGDLHGHSWQSDGMGDPRESFVRARDLCGDDFHALTDHDHFVGKRLTDAQWAEQKELVEHYHATGRFVTLFAQEWTTPRVGAAPHGWGHFNLYTADAAMPLCDHLDPRYRDLTDLVPVLREHAGLAIPHHIGWTGIRWDALDAELVPVVEICSVHGAYEYDGNEPIRHRGGLPGHFLRDGWAAGARVGVVGGTDQHGLIWQHGVCWKRNAYRAGLTGVWAPELTRGALLDALRARRTFATSGVKLQLYFAVNEVLMGGIAETAAAPRVQVDVAVPPDVGQLAWLQIVRDGQVVQRFGGEGQRSRYTFVDEGAPRGATACYYLRVVLRDSNMAWSSPVWVCRA